MEFNQKALDSFNNDAIKALKEVAKEHNVALKEDDIKVLDSSDIRQYDFGFTITLTVVKCKELKDIDKEKSIYEVFPYSELLKGGTCYHEFENERLVIRGSQFHRRW